MVKDYYTVKEAATVLDIYEVSARELLDGVIDFEADELWELAQHKNITVGELLK